MKIVFAGTPDFAADSLKALIQANHNIIAVYTQPDRPAGRGKKILKSPVKEVAEAHDLPVFQPEKLTESSAIEELASLEADLMIVAAYGLLLPKAVLELPTHGCINIHASLLPRWRGAAPIQRAIQAGDKTTGITIMQMDEGLDTGDMLLKLETPISGTDTGGSLHDKLAAQGAEAILTYLDQAKSGSLEPEQQDDSLSCYAKKLNKAEAQIDWNHSAEEICRTIRAFNPWPVAFIERNGERIRVFEAEIRQAKSEAAPGTVLDKSPSGIQIQSEEGIVNVLKLQLPGAKALSVKDFVNGGKAVLEPGEILQ